jgi:nucleoside-diphosphate-sugar epimerase
MPNPDPSSQLDRVFADRRVLILGGTGFIGSALANRLLQTTARITLAANEEWPDTLRFRDRVCFTRIELSDLTTMRRLVDGQSFLFNFAGVSGAADSNAMPFVDLDINGRGLLTVLEACREVNPGIRIIFPGSRLQYGKPEYLPVDEAHPMNPLSIYGIHKLLGEQYHLLYHRQYGMRATVLRISNAYGLATNTRATTGYNVANHFIRTALDDGTLPVFGDGRQQRDYIHIDDLVEAVLRVAATDETIGESYNLGIGEPTSLLELAEQIATATGRGKIQHFPWPPALNRVETGDFYYSIDKMATALGWRPTLHLPEGIKRSIASVLRG